MKKINLLLLVSAVVLSAATVFAGSDDKGITGYGPPDEKDAVRALQRDYRPHLGLTTEEFDLGIPDLGLTEEAANAVAAAPDWLKDDLADNFSYMDEAHQHEAAELILSPSDVNYRDEYCFMAAHIAPEMLMNPRFDFGIFEDNVSLIYEAAPLLSYVQLVEHGDPASGGEYYTTVTHRWLIDGAPEWREIPRDIYYWYIVHPKISDEKVAYVVPEGGGFSAPPDGAFWRSYLFYDSNVTDSYAQHYLEYAPQHEISDAMLDGWGPSAKGHLTDFEIAPTSIASAAGSADAIVLADIKWATGNKGSTILATTLRVEAAYDSGGCLLLDNMVEYGNGHTSMGQTAQIGIIKDQDQPEGAVIEDVLTAHGRNYDVLTSADIGVADLADYKKLIVPSYQPYELYQALADNRTWIEDWLDTHKKIFQIHLATYGTEDPAGLVFPSGFSTTSQSNAQYDSVEWTGYPILSDVKENAEYLWDGEEYNLWGGRFFEPGSLALDVIGNWVGKILNYRARGDRPIQPVVIARGHDGNCGELQDLLVAASRTMLIPAQCANNIAWDHVWGEFWADGSWRPYQVSWDRGSTHINNPGVAADSDYGGGKTLSSVTTWRGDEYKDAITHRYSDSCTLTVTVTDAEGNPVDGAKVSILAYPWGGSGGDLITVISQFTDVDGTTDFILGDERDFWGQVESEAGFYPDGDPVQVITESEPDAEYAWDVTVPGIVPQLKATPAAALPSETGDQRLVVHYEVTERALHPLDLQFQHTFSYILDGGNINFFICDADNFAAYRNDESFSAHNIELRNSESDVTFYPPLSGNYYAVIDTTGVLFVRHTVSLDIALEEYDGESWNLLDNLVQNIVMPASATAWAECEMTASACTELGVALEMPDTYFTPGDECYLQVSVCNNTGSPLMNNPLFVLLEVYGEFWFAPGWTQDAQYYPPPFDSGLTTFNAISTFQWPDTGQDSLQGIKFYGALLNESMNDIYGGWDYLEFGFGPE